MGRLPGVSRALVTLGIVALLSCSSGHSVDGAGGGDAGSAGVDAGGGTGGLAGSGGTVDAAAPEPGCSVPGDGITNCGSGESCCTTDLIPGGTFYRTYDGVKQSGFADPATVSAFRLDRYEVTVGRFRRFVQAWKAGWRPDAGSGRHAYLPGGGLNSGTEAGWDESFEPFANDAITVDRAGRCCQEGAMCSTLTPTPDGHETQPINCVSWYEAEAFCIWDGGFLPTEAEWIRAAANGSDQRVYPWSVPASNDAIDSSYAVYYPEPAPLPVGSKPKGGGFFGTADLAGNVAEWVLDSFANSYPTPCTDCYTDDASNGKASRGGSYGDVPANLVVTRRVGGLKYAGYSYSGVRCAHAP